MTYYEKLMGRILQFVSPWFQYPPDAKVMYADLSFRSDSWVETMIDSLVPYCIIIIIIIILSSHGIQTAKALSSSSLPASSSSSTCSATPSLSSTTRRRPDTSLTFWTPSNHLSSRRSWILEVGIKTTAVASMTTATTTTATSAILVRPEPCHAVEELPSFLKDYTKLAPLGPKESNDNNNKNSNRKMDSSTTMGKSIQLPINEIISRLSNDLVYGSTGQGGYFLTGDLSKDLFRDDCIFQDPTNRVQSLNQYQNALRILFNPKSSTVELIDPLVILPSPSQQQEPGQEQQEEDGVTKKEYTKIRGRIRSRGYLQLPWHPYVTAYESTIIYTIDEEGLIVCQDQIWSKDASKALQESFTPSFFNPPTTSHRPTPSNEPRLVTQLFHTINGRRPYEYSAEERNEINDLIRSILLLTSNSERSSDNQQQRELSSYQSSSLVGTWILAYLQPGPNGAGIDRRIPFPEFDFNDSYQIFRDDTNVNNGIIPNSVINIGQILGPLAKIQVYGTVEQEDVTTTRGSTASTPRRFQANIQGGKLCLKDDDLCIGLPIQGVGLFDSLYVGERLRIGQNLNGGGARVVQIRL